MNSIILSLDDIRAIIRHIGTDQLMDEVISELTDACITYDEAKYVVPVRGGFNYSDPHSGLLEWMPAMEAGNKTTLKVVGYHPRNPDLQLLPTILSVMMTFDNSNGHMIGLLDGTFPTAVRTGAASAIASRVLASPNSRVLGLIGAGAQAVTQLHALSREFQFEEVLVYDVDNHAGQSFVSRAQSLRLAQTRIRTTSLTEVVENADVLCTSTSVEIGQGPVFGEQVLKPWVHINAVGSDFPGKTEIPLSVLERALVCPDFRPQALQEGESQQLNPDTLGPDLVQLVRKAESYSAYRNKTTIFDSTGWALEDHIITGILIAHARELGTGTPIQIESIGKDPRDPYGFLSQDSIHLAEVKDKSRTARSV